LISGRGEYRGLSVIIFMSAVFGAKEYIQLCFLNI